ncbi:Hsp20/alpha crystallin family protein [Pseudomonas sp. Marseille-Q5115]|uniref:Hsp20/alpha crystallin family protein n=1 Tax=Pseudomonas sp. Marseille-Q5115 TaxID=2866593 RepID=UPI001CE3FD51|nr:Hsp20/alpha crystallin family protein [Pseudomonas sp. Marseille-Q5115]
MVNVLKTVKPKNEKPERNVSISTDSRHPFEHMRRQFEQLFHDFSGVPSLFPKGRRFDDDPYWLSGAVKLQAPAVDIAETEKSYEISAEVPGVDQKQLSVKVINGILHLKGEKLEEHEDTSKNYHLTERRYGSFERAFTLPKSVDAEGIEATFKHGVLKVTLPKKAEAIQPEKSVTIATD